MKAEDHTLHDWVRAVAKSNPFLGNRVTQPGDVKDDVETIHRAQFLAITRRVRQVVETGGTAGVLVTGAAGLGKSHLLSRVVKWADEERAALVVYLHNVLASPERMPRYLLRATLSALTGRSPAEFPQSALYALINSAIGPRLAQQGGLPTLEKRVEVLRRLGAEVDPESLVLPVFISFLQQTMQYTQGEEHAGELALAAAQWLSGETISPKRASALGLAPESEEGASLPDDEGIQRVFDVLARLCHKADRAFVLCIDQVDNLSEDKVAALCSFLHATLDNGRNLLVILSGVKQSMLALHRNGVIPDAAWDRLAQYSVELANVGPDEARQIVLARINAFNRPFRKVSQVVELLTKDALAPLSSEWLEARLASVIEARPRDVITWGRERWECEQDAIEERGEGPWLSSLLQQSEPQPLSRRPRVDNEEAVDLVVKKKLTEAEHQRSLNPETLPADADNLANLTFELLLRCVQEGYSLQSVDPLMGGRRPTTYHIIATERDPYGRQVTDGLTFLTADNSMASSWCLRRLQADSNPPMHQILITDEKRRPLRLGRKGQQVYEELLDRGLQHIKLDFADHVALDAMFVVLSAARVGDLELEVEGGVRPIGENECLASLHRQGVFLEHKLLRELLTETVVESTDTRREGFDPLMVRQRIVSELQWRLGLTGREMAKIIIEREKLGEEQEEKVLQSVLEVSARLHEEQHIFATAQDDDLFLQFRKKKQA